VLENKLAMGRKVERGSSQKLGTSKHGEAWDAAEWGTEADRNAR
jgi:hypothetical protein